MENSPNCFGIVLPNDPSHYSVIDLPSSGFKWTIENCTRFKTEKKESEIFEMGGHKWVLYAPSNKSDKDHSALHLKLADSSALPNGCSVDAKYSFAVVNQVDEKLTVRKISDPKKQFRFVAGGSSNWGWAHFMSLAKLLDPTQGFMVNDSIIIKAEVAVCRNVGDDSKKEDESALELSSMKELQRTAMIYYNKVPLQVMVAVDNLFDVLDINKDGKVSFAEFSNLMKEIGYESLDNPSFFDELSSQRSKELNRNDVITLYYILKSDRPSCDGCRRLIKGLFFTCETCFSNGGNFFNLHLHCLDKNEFVHDHANFVDTFTLLSFTRMKLLTNQNTTEQLSDDLPSLGFKWTIENCTRLRTKTLESKIFEMGGYKWFVDAFPNKSNKNQLEMFLNVADSASLPDGWNINAKYSLAVVNQVNDKLTVRKNSVSQELFSAAGGFARGWNSFMSLSELFDPSKGFMVNDSIIVKAEVAVCRNVEHDSEDSDEFSLELSSRKELRKTALIYYNKLPLKVMVAVNQIFEKMDINKDGKISFAEFSHFMKEIKCESLDNHSFFEELITDMSNKFNRDDVITLYYILKSGRPICDVCKRLIKGIFFTCETCFSKGESSFNLHRHCLDKNKFVHEHANFIDTFTLLSFTIMKLFAIQNGPEQVRHKTTVFGPAGSSQASSSSTSSVVSVESTRKLAFENLQHLVTQSISNSSCSIM